MKKLRLLWVGRLKKPFWKAAAEHYLASLGRMHGLEEVLLKDAPGGLAPAEAAAWEGKRVLEKLGPGDYLVCLDERGRQATSVQLSELLRGWLEDPARTPCLVVGGAHGLSPEVLARANLTLSLGPMTLPHELARVVLLEQLYRAASILRGLPYHHA
ncbi:MAG: 23S rRNA (pseudouridine(1915)-N(3))-methyltransferase RlmH [Thermodesulfobacteriota bacterium]